MARWTLTVLTLLLLAVWLASGQWFLAWSDTQPRPAPSLPATHLPAPPPPAGSKSVFVMISAGQLAFARPTDAASFGQTGSGWEVGVRRGGYGLQWGFPDSMTPDFWRAPLWPPTLLAAAAAGWAWIWRVRPRQRWQALGWNGLVRRAFEAATVLLLAAWLVSAWWSAESYVPLPGRGRGGFGVVHGRVGIGVTGSTFSFSHIEYCGFGLDWWFGWRVDTTYIPTERVLIIPIWTLATLAGSAAGLLRANHMRRSRLRGLCARCGYDLGGLSAGSGAKPVCPECGSRLRPKTESR